MANIRLPSAKIAICVGNRPQGEWGTILVGDDGEKQVRVASYCIAPQNPAITAGNDFPPKGQRAAQVPATRVRCAARIARLARSLNP